MYRVLITPIPNQLRTITLTRTCFASPTCTVHGTVVVVIAVGHVCRPQETRELGVDPSPSCIDVQLARSGPAARQQMVVLLARAAATAPPGRQIKVIP